ncbi:MAG: spore germination protein, partial [Anaerotignaceae bacterium]
NVALQISTKGWPSRGIPSAVNENTLLGPKDAFTEQASTNLVLVRRRIRDINLKVKRLKVGSRSKTDISILYMEDIVRKEVLKEVEESLQALDIDAIIDAGSLSQLMEKNTFSLFPQIQLTERPDKSASALYEGRVCVLVDNSPYAILVPAPLNVFFQSPEDYYGRWLIMSFLRLMRFVAGIYAATLPAVYIALVVFHPNLIPTSLALKIAGGRAFVPFPTIIEVLIIEFAFELLREAGLRLPTPASGTIGIVGGIVIGQSAVEAGIVGPAVVIIAAFTGICNFAIPNISLVNGIRLIKFILIIATSMLGLYGFWLGVIFLIIHLASMESYSIPYLFPFCSGDADNYTDFKDSIIRIPLIFMKKRPVFASSTQRIRMGIKKEDRKK